MFVPWPPTELHSLLPRAPSLRVYIFSFISGSAVEMLTTGFLVFTRTFVSLCLSNQPDPCCHIQSHHPLLEKFPQSSCGIPHQGLKDERGKSMCTCTCLKGDTGMWGRRHEEMLTHSNVLIAHTHTHTPKICLWVTSLLPCVTPAPTPGYLHTKVTNGRPGMTSSFAQSR